MFHSTNPSDCGVTDGTITIAATSSAGNAIEYSIDGGANYQSSNIFVGLDGASSPYEIRVRNVGGTCMVSNPDVTLIDKITPVITNLIPTDPSNCGIADGSIQVSATGASLEYSIDNGANWQPAGNFPNLGAGTYNVFVRNQDGSCTVAYISNPVILTAPNGPSITDVDFTDPTNCGLADGTIDITATGGAGSYQYSIDSGDTYQLSSNFPGLSGGEYCIFVTNADGTCIVNGQCVTLTDKVAPTIVSTVSANPSDCGIADGTIVITAASSAGNSLQYSIDGGATWDGSGAFTGLSAANNPYEIRVRNADGTCIVSDANITIIDKVAPVITNVVPTDPANCGVNDGSIVITATGISLEYSIDGGTNWQISGNFPNLGAGTYDIFVRNTDGSCNTAYGSNSVVLNAPNAPTITNVASADPTNCGVADGTITVTATGGSGSYEYSINGGTDWFANGGGFVGLDNTFNPYNIMVRNADGTCEVTGSIVTLTNPVTPTISSVTSTDPTECSVADGTITINATSSAGNAIEYSINGGTSYQSSNVFSALDASGNTYEIRVRNVGGTCVVSDADVTLTDKIEPVIAGVNPTNPSNCGINDGSIVITGIGVSLEFSIDGGTNWQPSGNFTNLGPGTYDVFTRNTDGSCLTAFASNSVILTAPNAPSITNVASTDPTDCALADGTITITAISGSGSYGYSIDSGATFQASNVFTGLVGGEYCVFVRNADGTCTVTGQCVTLTDKVPAVITSVASTDPTDCGVTDGTITITANSSTGNALQFSIDGGANWSNNGLFVGLGQVNSPYLIRVRNADGTCIVSDADVVITDKVQPVITNVAPVDPSNCGVLDGSITITATGATLEYSIDGGTNWQIGNAFPSLGAGTYNVFVRNLDGSCNTPYASNSVILTAPNAPSITNVATSNPTDCGVADGTITITAISGSGSYEYSIDSGATFQPSNVFAGLSGGEYCVFVRNLDGTCTVTGQCVNLIDKVAPVISNVASTNPTDCGLADGTITITASNSAGNSLEFSIDGGATWQVSNVFSALGGANSPYEIRVRNADGTCIQTSPNVIIIDKVQPVITLVTPTNPSNCSTNDGSIVITATGASLEYSIDGGTNWQASGNFPNLAPGTYDVFVRNTDGSCNTPYGSNSVILTVPAAASITNVATTDPTDCGVADGTIEVTAIGGTGNLVYSIDSGNTYQASSTFTGLAGGDYFIFVKNGNNTCIVTGPIEVLTDKVAATITSVASTDPTECGVVDGTITIDATPSAGNTLQYSIDGGSTWQQSGVFVALNAANNPYEIRVRNIDGTCLVSDVDINLTDKIQPVITLVTPTDPSNCGVNDGSIVIAATGASLEYSIDGGTNWQISGNFTGLGAGTYDVFVRNTDGSCNTPYSGNSIVLTIPNAPSITNVASSDPTDCGVANGTITVTATGGTAPLEYSIDGGSNWIANGGIFTGLDASNNPYQVMVRNADNTCEFTGSIVTLTDPVLPTISNVASSNPTDCGLADGTITITATSSAGNALEYSINGGATYQSSNVFSALDASGNPYEIRVRNVGGTCVVSNPDITLIDKVQPVITNVAPLDPSNCGINDGSIVVTATGASLEYSIDGGTNWQPSGNFTNLGAGTYNIVTRNADGSCNTPYTSNPVILNAPNSPSITNVVETQPTNCGVDDGTITITAIGGSGSYEYSIDSGSTTSWQASSTFDNLDGGTYYIFVRNANGTCLVVGPSVTLVDQVAPVIASVASTNPTDCGLADGTITITATSPAGNGLQYSIDGGLTWDGSGAFTGLDASNNPYEIRVRNQEWYLYRFRCKCYYH